MKRTGVCSKCGGMEIIRFDGTTAAYGAGNNIMVGISIMTAVRVNRYICCGCGFVEEWVDMEDIGRLKTSKKAKKV